MWPQRTGCNEQGNRLIDIAEDVEESLRFPSEAAYCGGDFDDTAHSQPVEGQISEGRQIFWRITAKDRAAILFQGHVADVMHAIFDGAPVASYKLQEFGGSGA